VKQISDNGIYLLIKYIKSFLWREAKHLPYMEDVRCLKVKILKHTTGSLLIYSRLNIPAINASVIRPCINVDTVIMLDKKGISPHITNILLMYKKGK